MRRPGRIVELISTTADRRTGEGGSYQLVGSFESPLKMSERGEPCRVDRQGRRRVNSDEFEPLTSWHDTLASGGGGMFGLFSRAKRCCCTYWMEAVLALWGLAVLFYLMSVDSGVHTQPTPAPVGLDLAKIAPTLESFETEFLTFYTTPLTTGLLLVSFPADALAGDVPPTKVIFGASYAKGSYDDHNSVALLHYPAESTDETVFSFRLTEDMAGVDVLREPLTLRTSDDGMETSLSESAPPEWITTLPVLEIVDGLVLTRADNLLANGFYVTDIQPTKLASLRIKLSETRAYPKNAGITVEYQLVADPGGEPGNVVPISIRFSVSALPSEPMAPRWGDERVGYFNVVYKDLGDHRAVREGIRSTDLLDTEVTLINRRRMRNPADEASAPDTGGEDGEGVGEGSSSTNAERDPNEAEPLTYYIDPSVPEEWREHMRAGVEAWRPAFDAAGLGGEAIRAVLPGEDAWPEDYDAGDIRFNSITWAVDVDEVFALGPATIDPRTGEILHSGIVFTNGWIKSWSDTFEIYGDSPDDSSSRRRSLSSRPHLSHGHEGHSHSHRHGAHDGHSHSHSHSRSRSGGGAGAGAGAGAAAGAGAGGDGESLLERLMPSLGASEGRSAHGGTGSLRYHERGGCQEERINDISMSLLPLVRGRRGPGGGGISWGQAHSGSGSGSGTGNRGLADEEASRGTAPGVATDAIIGAGLTDVVMHEVGHTLGLRHNFKGSTMLTLEELQDPTKTADVGLTSSVMDYLPLNIVSSKMQGPEEPHYFTPRIGEYDMWAIKYGYTPVEEEELLTESDSLKEVASQALPFSTDEDGVDSSGMNPLASVFDLGAEPMDYWEDQLELITELWPVLLERSTQQGEAQFQRYGYAALSLLRLVYISGMYSTKYIGGFDISKQRRVADDTPGPIQLIAAERQRRALTLILRVVAGDEPEGSAAFLPAEEDFSNLAVWDGECEGLGQYCYGVVPVDVLSEVNAMRKSVLLQAFSLERLMRLRLHTWATSSSNGSASGDVLTVSELFESTTNAVWGDGGFASARAKLWQNWDLMLFWFELLEAYGTAGPKFAVPGDVAATAVSLVYNLIETGKNLTAADPAFGLYRAASVKLNAWEELGGTDGVLLDLLFE